MTQVLPDEADSEVPNFYNDFRNSPWYSTYINLTSTVEVILWFIYNNFYDINYLSSEESNSFQFEFNIFYIVIPSEWKSYALNILGNDRT